MLTAFLAVAGVALSRLPVLGHLGALSVALLLGLAGRLFIPSLPPSVLPGIAFAGRTLLRLGIVLLGVRLNLDLLLHAGLRVLIIDVSVIVTGLVAITWLGRRFGLDSTLAALIAVDSSICGASAVAATAPTLRARDDEAALVIPLGSLIGTTAMLIFSGLQHFHPASDLRFGLMMGATLHEVAQVVAAVSAVPGATEIGTMTKLTRVVLLVPAVFALSWWMTRQRGTTAGTTSRVSLPKPWFVLGFLAVGIVHTLLLRLAPAQQETIASVDRGILFVATGLMAAAMAGMGLQVDFVRLRANGLRSVATAVLGWLLLAGLAAVEIALLTPA